MHFINLGEFSTNSCSISSTLFSPPSPTIQFLFCWPVEESSTALHISLSSPAHRPPGMFICFSLGVPIWSCSTDFTSYMTAFNLSIISSYLSLVLLSASSLQKCVYHSYLCVSISLVQTDQIGWDSRDRRIVFMAREEDASCMVGLGEVTESVPV